MNDGLVKRLVVICEHNFGTPKGTGPYFWQNVVQRILEEVMISTNAHGEVLVTHLALIARRAAHEYISTTAHKYKDIYKQNEAAELVSIRAVLSALAMMPVELPTADEIALVWLDGGKLGVLNLLRARLAPLLAARAATTADQPAVSIDDFAEALDLASTALPYDKRRRYNFDERFGRLVAKLELLRPGAAVGASVVAQAIGETVTAKDVAETPKRATLLDRFHEATGTKDSRDERIVSLGDLRELIRLLDT